MDTVVRICTFGYKYHFILVILEFMNVIDEPERELYLSYVYHSSLCISSLVPEVERLYSSNVIDI